MQTERIMHRHSNQRVIIQVNTQLKPHPIDISIVFYHFKTSFPGREIIRPVTHAFCSVVRDQLMQQKLLFSQTAAFRQLQAPMVTQGYGR